MAWSDGARIAAGTALAALLVACGREPEPSPAAVAPSPEPAAAPAPPPPAPRPLDRLLLVEAGRRAQAAFAAGATPAEPELAGRPLRVVLPFGCAGPVADLAAASAGWAYDSKRRTLRVVYRPQTEEPAANDVPAVEDATAAKGQPAPIVERFPVPFRWLATEGCPAGSAAPGNVGAAPETRAYELAVANLRAPEESRAGRRPGASLEIVRKAAPEEVPLSGRGLRLVLEGRVRPFPSGRVWRCSGERYDAAPVCELGARIDRIAIERLDAAEPLGEWTAPAP